MSIKKYQKRYFIKNKTKIGIQRRKRRLKSYLLNPIAEHLRFKKYISKTKKQTFDLTNKWAKENYTGYCALTGLKFDLSRKLTPFSPTVDRIDNSKGYIKNNCRVILRGLNMLKGIGTDEDMYKIAAALIKNKNLTKTKK
jgi:hypothetical protein